MVAGDIIPKKKKKKKKKLKKYAEYVKIVYSKSHTRNLSRNTSTIEHEFTETSQIISNRDLSEFSRLDVQKETMEMTILPNDG